MDYIDSFSRGGTLTLQLAIARAFGRGADPHEAAAYARQRWGARSAAAEIITKAAVSGGSSGSQDWAALVGDPDGELRAAMATATALDKLRDRRLVEPNIPVTASANASAAEFVAESKAFKISAAAFTRATMRPKKCVGVVVCSKEVIDSGGPKSLEVTRRDLIRATRLAVDEALLSSDAAGASDAGLGYNITPIPSSGTMAVDVAAALEAFTGEVETAAWITDASVAARLAAADFEGVGLKGGELLGVPLIVTRGSPRNTDGGQLLLVDQAMLLALDEGLDVSITDEAMLEMSDGPAGASDTPTAASQSVVSLFQTESVAIRCTRRLGWSPADGAVVIVNAIA